MHALQAVHGTPDVISGHRGTLLDERHESFNEGSDVGTLRLHASEAWREGES